MKIVMAIITGFFIMKAGQAQSKRIVFVCEHGSAKSVIAATYFNKLARENNLPWQAVARGTNPDQEISPRTKKLLQEEHLFDNDFVPQKLTQQDVNDAQQVVLFYQLPADIQDKNNTKSWLKVQAVNEDFKKLRDDIVLKITPLIDSLKKR